MNGFINHLRELRRHGTPMRRRREGLVIDNLPLKI